MMYLSDGVFSTQVQGEVVIDPHALGCSTMGTDDLYDRGLRECYLKQYGLTISDHCGNSVTIREVQRVAP